jgi:hypothetical protein
MMKLILSVIRDFYEKFCAMNEIICPHCDKAFKVDETGYAHILKQVRDSEFEKHLSERIGQIEADKTAALQLAKKDSEVTLGTLKASKDAEIAQLNFKIKENEQSLKLAVIQAVKEIEQERDNLKNNLQRTQLERQNAENLLRDKYETQIRDRDDAIDRLKDMKAKLSTKMIGETLEQHCESGSKGDYIFRDFADDGTEIISIMFEMKNENDTTATKSKNEDFFRELDKDRKEKGCEYAILVSMLESENELYNAGIVDVFHRYPKMYVIRPQFFIPMITLLRNAAMHSLKYKSELALIKEQNIDVTNFEAELETFKSAFGKNFELASRKFSTAIDEIDKSINHLQKTKDALLSTDRNLRLANDKAQDVTIKRLTRNNPTMKKMFSE